MWFSLMADYLLSFQALDDFATKLIENEHYAADDVASRRDAVSTYWMRSSLINTEMV